MQHYLPFLILLSKTTQQKNVLFCSKSAILNTLTSFKLHCMLQYYLTPRLKGLVGIAPSGAITFISQLYRGIISNCKIFERSGFLKLRIGPCFLKLEFDKGNTVIANKGFTIQDLLPLGVNLNVTLLLGLYLHDSTKCLSRPRKLPW